MRRKAGSAALAAVLILMSCGSGGDNDGLFAQIDTSSGAVAIEPETTSPAGDAGISGRGDPVATAAPATTVPAVEGPDPAACERTQIAVFESMESYLATLPRVTDIENALGMPGDIAADIEQIRGHCDNIASERFDEKYLLFLQEQRKSFSPNIQAVASAWAGAWCAGYEQYPDHAPAAQSACEEFRAAEVRSRHLHPRDYDHLHAVFLSHMLWHGTRTDLQRIGQKACEYADESDDPDELRRATMRDQFLTLFDDEMRRYIVETRWGSQDLDGLVVGLLTAMCPDVLSELER